VLVLLSPTLGITKEIMSQGQQVLDMECQESDDLSMAPKGPASECVSTNERFHLTYIRLILSTEVSIGTIGPTSLRHINCLLL
jgi:hypothetical protein